MAQDTIQVPAVLPIKAELGTEPPLGAWPALPIVTRSAFLGILGASGVVFYLIPRGDDWTWWQTALAVLAALAIPTALWLIDLPVRCIGTITVRAWHYGKMRKQLAHVGQKLQEARHDLELTGDLLSIATPGLKRATFVVRGTAFVDGQPRLIVDRKRTPLLQINDEIFAYDTVQRRIRGIFSVSAVRGDHYEATAKHLRDSVWWTVLWNRSAGGDSVPPANTVTIARSL